MSLAHNYPTPTLHFLLPTFSEVFTGFASLFLHNFSTITASHIYAYVYTYTCTYKNIHLLKPNHSAMATASADHKEALNSDLPPPLSHKVGQTSEMSEDATNCEITEITTGDQHSKPQHLVLEIPERTFDNFAKDDVKMNMPSTPQQTPKRVNFSPLRSPTYAYARFNEPSSPKGKSSIKSLIPKLSFKFRNRTSDIEKAAIQALGGSPSEMRRNTKMSRTLSLTKLFASRTKRTSSLPVTPIAHSNPESMHGRNTMEKGWIQRPMHRSHSVPVLIKDGSIGEIESVGGVFRIVPTTPKVVQGTDPTLNVNPTVEADGNHHQKEGEDIAEEEAVCRICMVELREGADDTLKMECNCRGELALAHQECAIKWFSIKGNKTCEVTKMGSGAIAISLPFSCILGLLASMTSTTMVKRRYAWIYAFIQFALVVGFAHVFYSTLHVQGVLSVLLATFAGFGGAMCATSIIYEFLKWRRSWHDRSNQPQGTPETRQPQESSEPADVPQDQLHQQDGSMEAIQPQQPTETGHAPDLQRDQARASDQQSGT
ncbi:hypothetical protein Ccrd_012101 [Cynara cardunculus var. scolymus]|uniref:RING-CH-type domain-containing protein n=1 Tax=Cynara cardunculus var. scolymus TaxID=59895 RepID=A0A124SHH2_CYNCS|nr:hypothetical protein Ccrd_012101 [Cynara cardunculus var. scolymus]